MTFVILIIHKLTAIAQEIFENELSEANASWFKSVKTLTIASNVRHYPTRSFPFNDENHFIAQIVAFNFGFRFFQSLSKVLAIPKSHSDKSSETVFPICCDYEISACTNINRFVT